MLIPWPGAESSCWPATSSRNESEKGAQAANGWKKTPDVIGRIEKLMEYETAGDPMSGLKWSRKTLRSVAQALRWSGVQVSANTVGRLLRDMNYSLHANRKTIAATSAPDRNQQMLHIAKTRKRFTRAGNPIISVDTKKKELVGQFNNAGAVWSKSPASG